MNPLMRPQENSDVFASVAPCAIDIGPDLVSPKPAIKLPETIEESIPVALRTSQHSHPAERRCNPNRRHSIFSGTILCPEGDGG